MTLYKGLLSAHDPALNVSALLNFALLSSTPALKRAAWNRAGIEQHGEQASYGRRFYL